VLDPESDKYVGLLARCGEQAAAATTAAAAALHGAHCMLS
jgi:hypothetical protein